MQVRKPVSVLTLVLAWACGGAGAPLTDAERQAIAASVDSATRAFEAAQRALDAERVVSHLAPDFYMYTDGRRVVYDSTVAQIRQTIPTLQHLEPGFADIEVIVLGRDGAVVSFTFRDSIVDASGTTFGFRGPTTLVWERRGTDWLIKYADADHYVKENP